MRPKKWRRTHRVDGKLAGTRETLAGGEVHESEPLGLEAADNVGGGGKEGVDADVARMGGRLQDLLLDGTGQEVLHGLRPVLNPRPRQRPAQAARILAYSHLNVFDNGVHRTRAVQPRAPAKGEARAVRLKDGDVQDGFEGEQTVVPRQEGRVLQHAIQHLRNGSRVGIAMHGADQEIS